jgi:hypothetical protein
LLSGEGDSVSVVLLLVEAVVESEEVVAPEVDVVVAGAPDSLEVVDVPLVFVELPPEVVELVVDEDVEV